jgi:hypothetical protein
MGSPAAAARLRMPSPAAWAAVLGGLVALSAAALLPLLILGHEQSDAVDPDAVRIDLGDVVRQALEPSHVSVWITRGGR